MNTPEQMPLQQEQSVAENAVPVAAAETEVSETAKTAVAETEEPVAADNADEKVQTMAAEAEAKQAEAYPDTVAEAEAPARFNTMTKEELVARLQQIVDSEDMNAHRTVAAIKAAFYAIRNKETFEEMNAFVEAGSDPDTFTSQTDAEEVRFKDLLSVFRDRRNAYLEAEEQTRMENLAAKNAILDQLRQIAEDIDNIGANFHKFHQLQQDFKVKASLPAGSENDLWKMYQTVNETFYDRLKMNKELRDLDFKKNLEAKRQLIEQAKELSEMSDPVAASARLQTLHAEWREIGPVAKELRDQIWEEFKSYSTTINRRHQEYFENRKAHELVNEEAKNEINEIIAAIDTESLKTMGAWDEAAKKVIELQAKWRTIGYATRKNNAALFTRFRTLCDDFFTRKSEFFKQVKDSYAENLKKKLDLCERAEAVAAEADVKKAADTVVKLQEEWKKAGPVTRRHSDEVWKRFNKACNSVFDARKRMHSDQRSAEQANLATKREIIEKLRQLPLEGNAKEVIGTVRELQAEWQKVGHVPFSIKDTIYAEYREVCDKIYDTYGAQAAHRRAQRFESRLDNMKNDERRVNRERERLVWSLEQKQTELQTINNNLGFFNVKSSAGSSLVKDIERRAEKIKVDIQQIKEKIAVIDARQEEQNN